ncbi:MAG: TIGR00730 family Rossman fold protein [Lysobacterales bacterium]
MRICVYCASSEACDRVYHDAARDLGAQLAAAGCTLVYGGGAVGLMGSVADAALAAGGKVIGIIPRFMTEVEWQHPGLAELDIVEDMRERKRRMLDGADAVVALPGGCGTLEELFEAMSLKRLGLYFGPIVLLDTAGYYAPLNAFLERMIAQRFMNAAHRGLWTLVARPDQVLPAIRATPPWPKDARDFAATRAVPGAGVSRND